jgi:superfamily II DNA/RNA helicase
MRLMVLVLVLRSARGFVASHRTILPRLAAGLHSPAASHRLYSSTSSTEDASAFSKSRAPFSMPKGSSDDSKVATPTSAEGLAWNAMGLWTELVDSLTNDLQLERPTAVQQLAIPHLLNDKSSHLTFLAATGSGKTLAYSLPLLQKVKENEVFGQGSAERRPRRPSLLILAPTRELCHQISSDTIKKLCHKIKLSSTVLTGKDDYGKQRKALNRPIDIVVATPGRFLQHWRDKNVHIGDLQYVVLDEMDTMVEQGFAKELKEILYPALYRKQSEQTIDVEKDLIPDAPKVIMTSATMTQSIQRMVGDTDMNTGAVTARKHYVKQETDDPTDQRGLVLPKMPVLKAKGLHKAVPRLKQVFVDVGSGDKLSLLTDILGHGGSGAALKSASADWAAAALTMIFCNTASACRAVQYALAEAQIETLAYHGELNSEARSENLQKFRLAGKGSEDEEYPRILVCTDLAARGLDVPQVDHIVMFDFPLNVSFGYFSSVSI